jgi:hypothetical protein
MSRSAITSRQTLNFQQNLFLHSEVFNNAYWVSSNGIQAPQDNQIANPINGNMTAALITDDSTNGTHRFYGNTVMTLKDRHIYCLSAYFMQITHRYVTLTVDPGSTLVFVYDLQTGTLVSSNVPSNFILTAATNITALPNGWYRLGLVFQMAASGVAFCFFGFSGDGTVVGTSYAGSSNKSFYIYGAQFVESNWPGFYTATIASQFTNPIRKFIFSRTPVTSRSVIS